MIVIGICGKPGAGKNAAARRFVGNWGFQEFNYTEDIIEPVIELAKKSPGVLGSYFTKFGVKVPADKLRALQVACRGDVDRAMMTRVTAILLSVRPDIYDWIGAQKFQTDRIVLSSVRQLEGVKLLKGFEGVDYHLIEVFADPKVRWERAMARASEKDRVDYEQFLEQEEDDLEVTGLGKLLKSDLIDFRIDNNGTVAQLNKQVDQIAKRLKF